MNKEIKDALATLRKKGIRIPRSFTRKLKNHGYEPTRKDLRLVKKRITGMSPENIFVICLSQKGRITVYSYEAYQKLVGTAEKARGHKKEMWAHDHSK